jgi:hypothetical protein
MEEAVKCNGGGPGLVASRDCLHRGGVQEVREAHVRPGGRDPRPIAPLQFRSGRQHAKGDRYPRRGESRRGRVQGPREGRGGPERLAGDETVALMNKAKPKARGKSRTSEPRTVGHQVHVPAEGNRDRAPGKGVKTKKELSPERREELLKALKARFEKNMDRHKGLEWAKVQTKLEANEANTEKLWSLSQMERTGGEPDVVGHDQKTGEYIFFDCSAESPKGRTSVCYDREGLDSRKEHRPANSAIDMAADMGIELLNEEEYRELQKLGNFDAKTSSWVKTPADIRNSAAPSFVIAATAMSSCIITERSHIMAPERSVAR